MTVHCRDHSQTDNQTTQNRGLEEWIGKQYNRQVHYQAFTHMTTPNPRDSINLLRREEQVTTLRLRCGHVPLNAHLKRTGLRVPSLSMPWRNNGTSSICMPTARLRIEYLPQNPDIANTLYANPEQLRNTHRYFVMASGWRVRAHWLLVQLNK